MSRPDDEPDPLAAEPAEPAPAWTLWATPTAGPAAWREVARSPAEGDALGEFFMPDPGRFAPLDLVQVTDPGGRPRHLWFVLDDGLPVPVPPLTLLPPLVLTPGDPGFGRWLAEVAPDGWADAWSRCPSGWLVDLARAAGVDPREAEAARGLGAVEARDALPLACLLLAVCQGT